MNIDVLVAYFFNIWLHAHCHLLYNYINLADPLKYRMRFDSSDVALVFAILIMRFHEFVAIHHKNA